MRCAFCLHKPGAFSCRNARISVACAGAETRFSIPLFPSLFCLPCAIMYPEKHAIQINIKENNMLKRRILSVLLVLAMLVPFAGAAQTATGQYARRLGRKRSEHRLSVLCRHDRAGARRRGGHHARQHRGDGPEHGLSSGASLGGCALPGPAFSPRAATSAAPAALRPTGTSMCSRTGSRARTSAVFSCTPGSIPTASRETAGRSLTPCREQPGASAS